MAWFWTAASLVAARPLGFAVVWIIYLAIASAPGYWALLQYPALPLAMMVSARIAYLADKGGSYSLIFADTRLFEVRLLAPLTGMALAIPLLTAVIMLLTLSLLPSSAPERMMSNVSGIEAPAFLSRLALAMVHGNTVAMLLAGLLMLSCKFYRGWSLMPLVVVHGLSLKEACIECVSASDNNPWISNNLFNLSFLLLAVNFTIRAFGYPDMLLAPLLAIIPAAMYVSTTDIWETEAREAAGLAR